MVQEENNKRWYIIHAYSGQEDRVKNNLEQQLGLFFKIHCPSQRTASRPTGFSLQSSERASERKSDKVSLPAFVRPMNCRTPSPLGSTLGLMIPVIEDIKTSLPLSSTRERDSASLDRACCDRLKAALSNSLSVMGIKYSTDSVCR